MHTNGTVIYYDPLSADQPLTVSGDAGTQAGAEGGAATTTTTGTAATGAETGEVNMLGSMLSLIVPLLLMGVVFYFFLIRPQRKKDKAVKNMLDALKTGDRICTPMAP